jgi:hypothetical protein
MTDDFDLDSEMRAFIASYQEASSLSTATSIEQQRSDYEAMLRRFRYPHPPGLNCRDDIVEGRHGGIPLRHYRLTTWCRSITACHRSITIRLTWMTSRTRFTPSVTTTRY